MRAAFTVWFLGGFVWVWNTLWCAGSGGDLSAIGAFFVACACFLMVIWLAVRTDIEKR